MTIDVAFNDEQKLIQKTARDFFSVECPPALVRKYEQADAEFPRELWRQMAGLDWLGMAFPANSSW